MKNHERFRSRLEARLRKLSSSERRLPRHAKEALQACERRAARPLNVARAAFIAVLYVEGRHQ